MGDIQDSPESSAMDPGTPDCLNNAFLFEDPGSLVPETPSPLTLRRKRQTQKHDYRREISSSISDSRKLEAQEHIPGYLSTTPSSQRTMKRRKLENLKTCTQHGHYDTTLGANGFIKASSLLSSDFTWLESPRPAPFSASNVSASSSAGSSACALDQSNDPGYLNELLVASKQKPLNTSNKTEKRSKKTISSRTRSKASASALANTPLLAVNDVLLGSTHIKYGPAHSLPCPLPEDIVIIEDDADDVESMVRCVQMAEDEAYAKSLQEQFDMEERMEQEQQRQQSRPSSTNTHNHMVDPYVGLGWISPWASMISSPSFSHGAPELSELQHAIFGEPSRRQQGHPQTGRTRNSRRRPAAHLQTDLFDDSHGNNYEALLAFEEQQGAVVTKNNLTKAEIERLPIKEYNPAHSAGKTDCQICFSEYKAGERLRMLPCLHDYHVKCIDRWLKENATCPICRADVSECSGFS